MKRVYTIRMVRPVFETTVVEVESFSEGVAIEKALERASRLGAEAWESQDIDPTEYGTEVVSIVENQQVYETSSNPHRELREFRAGGHGMRSRKYLLLAADLETGEAELVLQPWFGRLDGPRQAELCASWSQPLDLILENDGLEDRQAEPGIHTTRITNVVAFPRK